MEQRNSGISAEISFFTLKWGLNKVEVPNKEIPYQYFQGVIANRDIKVNPVYCFGKRWYRDLIPVGYILYIDSMPVINQDETIRILSLSELKQIFESWN